MILGSLGNHIFFINEKDFPHMTTIAIQDSDIPLVILADLAYTLFPW